MRNLPPLTAVLLLCGCVVADIDPPTPPVVTPPTSPPVVADNPDCPANVDITGPMRTKITCDAFCRPETAPRSSLQRISWIDDARGKRGTSRVDVSVYKTGFAENAYSSFCRAPNAVTGSNADHAVQLQMPALGQETAMQFELVESRTARKRGEPNVLIVKDLEPGKAYFWRAVQRTDSGWFASDVLHCIAAVCPIDYVDEQNNRRPPGKDDPGKHPGKDNPDGDRKDNPDDDRKDNPEKDKPDYSQQAGGAL